MANDQAAAEAAKLEGTKYYKVRSFPDVLPPVLTSLQARDFDKAIEHYRFAHGLALAAVS
jgi:cobalamin biosynthesis protein CobD/CbiB